MLSPDDLIKLRARKVVDNGVGPHAIPLAQLTESILLNESIANLTKAVESIEIPEAKDVEIPEFPSEITVSNLPEVQKVEITNLPNEKDDKEQLKLLKQIAEELKKKEQYDYDIEIDSTLKEQLRGEKGEPGKNGIEITSEEVRDKLLNLNGEDRLDASAIKGLENLVKETKVYGSRLLRNLADVNGAKEAIDGQVLTKQADGTFAFETPSGGGSGATTFETVSKNLDATNATIAYNGSGDVTSITYSSGVIKTINYNGSGDVSSIVLSGSTPSGISLTKTFTYTGSDVTGIAYT